VADVNGDGKPDLLVANSDDQFNNSTAAVLINTSVGSTTTALASSPNPSSFGQAVTFTATVTSQFFKFQPTGTMSFYDGTTNIGNSNLNGGGVAILMTSTLSLGTHSITATYNGDTNFAPSTSSVLYQVVQGAVVSLSPTGLNFGNQNVDTTSPPQVVTLTNTGNINLTITSIQITGTNSGDFAQNNNCPSSLSPSNSCNISVTFTPTATGIRNAAASITDNAPGSPQSVPLTGVGVLPAVTFSPTSLNFGNQTAGTTSSPQMTTLTNTGQGTLTISSIGVTGANASEFAQTNNCPSSLSPNNSCNISVTFSPKALGAATASISVADNAPGSPQAVPLTGIGVTGISVSPPSVDFPNQYVGTSGLPQAVTLTNTADAVITITNVTASPADFAPLSACGNSISPGAKCSIGVFSDPSTSGTRNGVLTITDSAINSPQTVPLSGMGQDFSVTPSSSSTATVAPGQAANYTVQSRPAAGSTRL